MSGMYEPLFRHVLFPLYESVLRWRKTLRYLDEYEHNQWLGEEEIRALQWQKLQRLLRHCWEQVPYYRQQWQNLGIAAPEDIRNRDDFARLPLLTKHDIRENFDALQAGSQAGQMLYKTTGGSTGVPLRFGYTRESYERRTAVMWRGYGWAGAHPGTRTAYLWGGAVGNPSRTALLKDRAYHAAFNRRMLDSFSMSEANLAKYADAIAAFRPEVVVSYVTPIVQLATWMNGNGRRIHGVRSVVGAAETLHDFHRPVIESAFPGARAFNTYGCREFMLIASECECHDGLHVNADHLYLETLPDPLCETDPQELVLTDLSNYGMPFLRYVNGDLAIPGNGERCNCGRSLPKLRHVVGRKLDMIRSVDGRLLPGEFFPHMLKDVPSVLRFQVVQTQLDELLVKVVPDDTFSDEQERYIREQIARLLGDTVHIDLRRVEEIPLTATGKHRVTISELH
jgi:phenylacetate-CoA ligase